MKKNNGIQKKAITRSARLVLTITTFLLVACVFCAISFAQSDSAQTDVHDKSLKSYKMPQNLKKHLEDKYKGQIVRYYSQLQETPQGPRGKLTLDGKIKTQKNVDKTGDRHHDARAIAKAFLEDEADLLGLPDLNELREDDIHTSETQNGAFTHLKFTRCINGVALQDSYVHIVIGPNDVITYMDSSIVPVTSEMYRALRETPISIENARQIINKDLRANGVGEREYKVNPKLYAIPTAPYAVWKANIGMSLGRQWEYKVNAFTGEILDVKKIFFREE